MRTGLSRLGIALTGTLALAATMAFAPADRAGGSPVERVEREAGTIQQVVRHNTDRHGVIRRFESWTVRGDAYTIRMYGEYVDLPNYPLMDYATKIVRGRLIGTEVVHRSKTWYRHISTPDPSEYTSEELAKECSYSPGRVAVGSRCEFSSAEIWRDTRGPQPQLVRDGEQTIDGRRTIRLRDTTAKSGRVARYLYVDADSYEIVRIEEDFPQSRTPSKHSVQDYYFLEPTEANRSLLEAQIPKGYKRTPDRTDHHDD